jgi:hypothetical protein
MHERHTWQGIKRLKRAMTMTDTIQSRGFIRHPTDIPIRWSLGDIVQPGGEHLRNISEGGLAFDSFHDIPVGASIDIHIPLGRPEVSVKGEVVWCRPTDDGCFEIGVRFIDAGQRFKMRMVEQVCHIEQYKKELLENEGRSLTSEQAAMEWIKRFAKDFPS